MALETIDEETLVAALEAALDPELDVEIERLELTLPRGEVDEEMIAQELAQVLNERLQQ